MKGIIRFINAFSEWTGRIVSWLVLIMVVIIVFDVAMRYLLQLGSVALQELEWHLFALVFMLGSAYTLKHDGHVRVDIFYNSRWMNDVRRAWVNLLGTLFLLFPFCLLIIYSAWPFVMSAYNIGEGSPDPGGLAYRFLLKAVIPFSFLLLTVQGVALLLSSLRIILDSGVMGDSQKSSQTQLDSSPSQHPASTISPPHNTPRNK